MPPAVACVMLGAGRGGLEQALLDYAEALAAKGHPVTAVCHPKWLERPALEALPVRVAGLKSFNEWDLLAAGRLRRIIRAAGAAAVLTIGRRATSLVRLAASPHPQVAVAQNYSLKPMIGLEHVFATTADLRRALIEAGQPAGRITVIPNMVRVPRDVAPPRPCAPGPLTIGAMGRLVRKKGFADLVDALALLRDRGLPFVFELAGDGPEAAALERQVDERGLAERTRLVGWVTDKRTFFESIDVFCVPSLHEPFGIVVIEGFAHARPTVVTDAEGPREIVRHGEDGLVVPRHDPLALADALAGLLQDPALRARLAGAALERARDVYDLPTVGGRISAALNTLLQAGTAV